MRRAISIREKLVSTASTANIIGGEMPIVETFNVLRVVYTSYKQKVTERPMIKVAYHCDRLKTFFENITVEVKSPGAKMDYPVKLGRDWFRQRHHIEPPLLNETVLRLSDQLRVPARVNVWLNKPGTTLGSCFGSGVLE
jgi:DNA repair protein RadD